jgi:ribonuclease D
MEGTIVLPPENKIRLINTDEGLQEIMPLLRQAGELGADLEFDQNRHTYGFTLCLVQLSDGQTSYLIDPFPIQDLQPLLALMADPAVTKIFHHSNNDLLLLSKLGCQTHAVVDTDIAAKILNYEKASLANVMAEEFGVTINKAMQASNWNKRPLTEEQIRYAALDVQYLRPLKEKLVGKIRELGRMRWLEEECHLLERITYLTPDQPHLRLKGISRFSEFDLFILEELYAFREELAQQLNKPSGYIISNDALVDLALHPQTDVHEWVNHTRGIHGRLKSDRHSRDLVKVLRQARQQAEAAGLSQQQPERRYKRPVETPETQAREEQALCLQAELASRYGTHASRLLLNQSMIQYYTYQGHLLVPKHYARDIINDVVAELNLDLKAQPVTAGL